MLRKLGRKSERLSRKFESDKKKTYYLYAGFHELYITDHKLSAPYIYQAENTNLNELLNDNISDIDDDGNLLNPDAEYDIEDNFVIDKNIIDDCLDTDLFGIRAEAFYSDDPFWDDKTEEELENDYGFYDISEYYEDSNESKRRKSERLSRRFESHDDINEDEFTDRVDADFDISLYDYGVVRNPKNDMTLIGRKPGDDGSYTDYTVMYISFDDVKDVIENTMEDGFFDYIGETKEEVLSNLDNDTLAIYIQSINSYNGWWSDQTYYYESRKRRNENDYQISDRDCMIIADNIREGKHYGDEDGFSWYMSIDVVGAEGNDGSLADLGERLAYFSLKQIADCVEEHNLKDFIEIEFIPDTMSGKFVTADYQKRLPHLIEKIGDNDYVWTVRYEIDVQPNFDESRKIKKSLSHKRRNELSTGLKQKVFTQRKSDFEKAKAKLNKSAGLMAKKNIGTPETIDITFTSGFCETEEDDYEQGALGSYGSSWDNRQRKTITLDLTKSDFVKYLAAEMGEYLYCYWINEKDINFRNDKGDFSLGFSTMGDKNNEKPTDTQIDNWTKGLEKLWIIDGYISVEVSETDKPFLIEALKRARVTEI